MFKVEINDNKAWCTEKERLTTGLVGEPISFEFSSEWDELTVYAVFRAYDTQITVHVDDLTGEYEIPTEVLQRSNVKLYVGFYGYDAIGNKVITSLYADLGMIHEGADPEASENFAPVTIQMYTELLLATQEAAASAAIAQDALERISGAAAGDSLSFSINNAGHLIETIVLDGVSSSIDLGEVAPDKDTLVQEIKAELASYIATAKAEIAASAQTAIDTADAADEKADAAVATANAASSTADDALAAANSSITTARIANSAVTGAKLATGAVSATNKIADGVVTYAKTDGTTIQKKLVKMSLSLASGKKSWSVTATGIDSSSWVLVSPAPGSFDEWVDKGVRCSGQGSNTLSFSATSNTTKALTAYVVAVPGG